MRARVALTAGLLLLAATSLAWYPALGWVRAGELLVALSPGHQHAAAEPLVEQELWIDGERGPIRARLYRRADEPRGRGIVVAHGVHYRGIDERRLVPFARSLARAGLVVLTPELRDLMDYRITAHGISVVTDSVRYLESRQDRIEGSKVGLLGFSFAGGQALVAARRPALRGRLEYVTSVGGYHDLDRVLHFLMEDEIDTPKGRVHLKAHEYGLVVLVYDHLDRLVPGEDVGVMQAAFRAWLHEDRDRAIALASRRHTAAGEHLFQLLQHHRLHELCPRLEAIVARERAELAALSPRGHLSQIDAPVYLLHGAGDTVIPPSEARWAALELGSAPHDQLVTPLLDHVEISGVSGLRQELALLGFMAHLMS